MIRNVKQRKVSQTTTMRYPVRAILVVILVLLIIGALPAWPYSSGWGYYPSGGLGTLLVILLILAVAGVI